MQTIWNEEVRTKYAEGDYYRKWKLNALFLALQESASIHAQHLGFGYDQLIDQDLAWVLSRFKIHIQHLPSAGDLVRVQTWPKGIQQKLFCMRDFFIMTPDGDTVYAEASSAWLLINTHTRRMQLPAVLGDGLPDNAGRSALDEPLERIEISGALQEQFTVQARTSMLDLMGHVTSSRYLEWVCDCFPVETFLGQDGRERLSWLQINFNREVRPGECVSVTCGRSIQDPSTWFIQGNNLDTGVNAFDACVGFNL
jgi:medium-chain acyl-[acyl-carrier-protein] hydrolase